MESLRMGKITHREHYFRLGAGKDAPSLHNTKFLPPDSVIENGVKVMTAFALESLKR